MDISISYSFIIKEEYNRCMDGYDPPYKNLVKVEMPSSVLVF